MESTRFRAWRAGTRSVVRCHAQFARQALLVQKRSLHQNCVLQGHTLRLDRPGVEHVRQVPGAQIQAQFSRKTARLDHGAWQIQVFVKVVSRDSRVCALISSRQHAPMELGLWTMLLRVLPVWQGTSALTRTRMFKFRASLDTIRLALNVRALCAPLASLALLETTLAPLAESARTHWEAKPNVWYVLPGFHAQTPARNL